MKQENNPESNLLLKAAVKKAASLAGSKNIRE